MTATDPTESLRAICARVGFDLDRVDPSVLDRMRLLACLTHTVDDMERIAGYAFDVFQHYEVERPADAFGASERRIVVLGCLFSDIGKSGPKKATPEAQRLIVEMFGVEGVTDERQPVARFLDEHFPDDSTVRRARFEALDLDPAMSIRTFWNHHGRWTLEILEGSGVPTEAVAAAATHHRLDDINPDSIVGDDDRFTRPFGVNVAFDRAEKLIIVLDKYDAVRRRGRLDHDRAIAWLRERVAQNARYQADEELATLIGELDAIRAGGG